MQFPDNVRSLALPIGLDPRPHRDFTRERTRNVSQWMDEDPIDGYRGSHHGRKDAEHARDGSRSGHVVHFPGMFDE